MSAVSTRSVLVTRENGVVTDASPQAPHSQTLSRGIRVLEILADSREPLSIGEIAATLGVHRSIAYRILRTLEDHTLVARDAHGDVSLAPKMATLARGVERDLQSAALPELTKLADELHMTTFLVVLDHQECVTLASVEPRASTATVAQRPGTRHSLAVGAPGIAIQSLLTDAQLAQAGLLRRRHEALGISTHGFAASHDEVIPGLQSVAVPLAMPRSVPAALAVVYVSTALSKEDIGIKLERARDAISPIEPARFGQN